jgi:hypothetical protein
MNATVAVTIATTSLIFDEMSTTLGFESTTDRFNNVTRVSNAFHNVTDIHAAPPIVEDQYLHLIYSQKMLVRYGPPIIIILGVVGNALSLLVLCRQQYTEASTTWYMKTIAIYDIINSIAWPGLRWVTTHYPHVAIAMGDVFCKGYFFGGNWLVTTSSWILVFMTIDRTISVCKPLIAGQICTVSRARKTVIGLTIFFALFASPCFTRTMKIKQGAINRAQCPFNPAWLYKVFYYAVVVVRLWAAPVTVLICNIVIMAALFRRKQKRVQMSMTVDKNKRREATLNAMLMLVSWVFIVCYFPNAIDILVWNIGYPKPWTPRQFYTRKITFEVIALLMYLNHAVNFYLYVLGVKKFRKDFIDTFRCNVKMTAFGKKLQTAATATATTKGNRSDRVGSGDTGNGDNAGDVA